MKIQIGNRCKVIEAKDREDFEKQLNEFMAQFDSKGDDIFQFVNPWPLGNVGYKAMVQFGIYKDK